MNSFIVVSLIASAMFTAWQKNIFSGLWLMAMLTFIGMAVDEMVHAITSVYVEYNEDNKDESRDKQDDSM